MTETLSDFSKILELQEIKKLYDDSQERHSGELRERDREIERLRTEMAQLELNNGQEDDQVDQLKQEKERLGRQVQLVREEYETKIDRLNARIRELSASGGRTTEPVEAAAERKGFFRR